MSHFESAEEPFPDETDISKRLLNPFISHICESSTGTSYIPPEE